MEKGTFIEMMTPKELPRAVSLSISSHSDSMRAVEIAAREAGRDAVFRHPNGAQRLTRVRVVAPGADGLPPAATYVARHGLMKFDIGSQWLLDVTLDNGSKGVTKDLRPDLPMVVHY